MPRPWRSSSTAKSESPQTPSRTSASATPTTRPSRSATHAPPGSVSCEVGDRGRPAGVQLRLVLAGRRREERAARDGVGALDVVGAQGADADLGGGHARKSSSGGDWLPWSLPWPSPSRSSRTPARHKRRSQHKISAPTYNACPQCHSPRRPHRVCPVCGTYGGREVVDAARTATTTTTTTEPARGRRRSRSTPTARTSVPPRSPPGAAIAAAQGVARPALRPGRRDRRGAADGVEVVDAPVSIAKAADPARAARSTPDASIVQAAQRRRRRRGRRARQRRLDRRRARRRRSSTSSARPGIYRPGARRARARSPARRSRCSTSAPTPRSAREHLVQFAFMGAALRAAACSASSARASALLSNGEEATKGTPLVIEAHELLRRARAQAAARCDFVGNVEGTDVTNGAADVVVTDGFTGNVALKLMEGVSQAMLEADPRARALASHARKVGGLLLRPALRALRDEIDPEAPGRRLPARPAPARRRAARALHPLRHLAGDPAGRARRASRRRRSARTRRSRRRARCGACPTASGAGSSVPLVMTRDEVLTLVRDHLADELDLDPGAHRRGHALQGGPRGRLARPLHARPGARGHLRRAR